MDTFSLLQGHHATATIDAHSKSRTTRPMNPGPGPLSSFELTLTGRADSETMRLWGAVTGQARRTIQIILSKTGDLVDPSASCAAVAATVVGA